MKEQNNFNKEIAPEVSLRHKIIEAYINFINAHSKLQTAFKTNKVIPKDVFCEYIERGNTIYHLIFPYIKKYTLKNKIQALYINLFENNNLTKEHINEFANCIMEATYISGLIKIDQATNKNPIPLDMCISDLIEKWMDDEDANKDTNIS